MRAAAAVVVLSAALAGGVTAVAQTAPLRSAAPAEESGPRWSALTPAQRAALRPLQAEWPSMDASRKTKWLAMSERFATMPEVERQRLQERMAEWARLSPAERGRARENYQALRTVPPADRQALWEAYQALPPERKTELAQRPSAAPKSPGPADVKGRANGKRNIVPPSTQQVATRPVNPTMVQARPGATTTLVTRRGDPPPHTQPGLPKIAAVQGFVNPKTLLPSRGPQGAAVIPTPPATIETAE